MKRLTLTYRGETIVSDTFNMRAWRTMRAMRLIAPAGDAVLAVTAAALEGVIVLFDGTALTEDVLRHSTDIDAAELEAASGLVIEWFLSAAPKPGGAQMVGRPPSDSVLALYHDLLFTHGILPGQVDREDPFLLFDVLGADMGDAVDARQIPDEYKTFYGL